MMCAGVQPVILHSALLGERVRAESGQLAFRRRYRRLDLRVVCPSSHEPLVGDPMLGGTRHELVDPRGPTLEGIEPLHDVISMLRQRVAALRAVNEHPTSCAPAAMMSPTTAPIADVTSAPAALLPVEDM
jgi:hypothetical protein